MFKLNWTFPRHSILVLFVAVNSMSGFSNFVVWCFAITLYTFCCINDTLVPVSSSAFVPVTSSNCIQIHVAFPISSASNWFIRANGTCDCRCHSSFSESEDELSVDVEVARESLLSVESHWMSSISFFLLSVFVVFFFLRRLFLFLLLSLSSPCSVLSVVLFGLLRLSRRWSLLLVRDLGRRSFLRIDSQLLLRLSSEVDVDLLP